MFNFEINYPFNPPLKALHVLSRAVFNVLEDDSFLKHTLFQLWSRLPHKYSKLCHRFNWNVLTSLFIAFLCSSNQRHS